MGDRKEMIIKVCMAVVGLGLMIAGFQFEKPNVFVFAPGAILLWFVVSPLLKTKRCGTCGEPVSMGAQRGDRCPKCNTVWS
jgi:hypothetical protein